MVKLAGVLVRFVPPGIEDCAVTVTVTVLPTSWLLGVPVRVPVIALTPSHVPSQLGAPVQVTLDTAKAVGTGMPLQDVGNVNGCPNTARPGVPVSAELIAGAIPVIATVSLTDAVRFAVESFALTLNRKFPGVVGVPESTPAALNDNPDGKLVAE